MSSAKAATFRSCGVTTINGRRTFCQSPATNRARAVPARPDTTTSVSPFRVSAAMRRKSAAAEILERIFGMRLSRTSTILDALQNPLDNACRGLARHKREGDNFSTPTFDFFTADDVVHPVGALHENVRPDIKNGFQRCVFVK